MITVKQFKSEDNVIFNGGGGDTGHTEKQKMNDNRLCI